MSLYRRLLLFSVIVLCFAGMGAIGGGVGCGSEIRVCKEGSECEIGERCIQGMCRKAFKDQNLLPVARAGQNLRIKRGVLVKLDGSTSSDANQDRLTYQWSFARKPSDSKAEISDSKMIKASFKADVSGLFEVRLTVTDALGAEDDDVITIRVNTSPQANAGGDQLVLLGASVLLNADGSSELDETDPVSYRWKLLETPTGSKASLQSTDQKQSQFKADIEGTYKVQLIVSDGLEESTDTMTAKVVDPAKISPVLRSVDPPRGPTSSVVKITIYGEDFIQGAKLFFDGKPLKSQYKSSRRMTASLTLNSTKKGRYEVKVVNPGGRSSKPFLFQVDDPPNPTLVSITPEMGTAGEHVKVILKGDGFVLTTKVYFNNEEISYKYIDTQTIEAKLSLVYVRPGDHEIFVKNDKDKSSNSKYFSVLARSPKPQIFRHSFVPGGAVGYTGQLYKSFTLDGKNFGESFIVFLNGKPHKEVKLEVTPGKNFIHLSNVSTENAPNKALVVAVRGVVRGKPYYSNPYRIFLLPPSRPSVGGVSFDSPSGSSSDDGYVNREYQSLTISGSNFHNLVQVMIDGKKHTGNVQRIASNTIKILDFNTKGMSVGKHTLAVNNAYSQKVLQSNIFEFVVKDGHIPTITKVVGEGGGTTLNTVYYNYVLIHGKNFRNDYKVYIDNKPYTARSFRNHEGLITLYKFSADQLGGGKHSLVVENKVGGKLYRSPEFFFTIDDRYAPKITSVSFGGVKGVAYPQEFLLLKVEGKNFLSGAFVRIDKSTNVRSVEIKKDGLIVQNFSTMHLPVGTHTLEVVNQVKTKYFASKPFPFEIKQRGAPEIYYLSPRIFTQKKDLIFTVEGLGVSKNTKLYIDGKSVAVSLVIQLSSRSVAMTVDTSQWKVGKRSLTFSNTSGQQSKNIDVACIPLLGPTIHGTWPQEIHLPSQLDSPVTISLEINGTNLKQGANIYIQNKKVGKIHSVIKGSKGYGTISLGTSFSQVQGEIFVENPDGKKSNKTEIWVYQPQQPEIFELQPSSFSASLTSLTIKVLGRGFSSKSVILLNGKALSTQYRRVNIALRPYGEELTATLPQSWLKSAPAKSKIKVLNPDQKKSKEYTLTKFSSSIPILSIDNVSLTRKGLGMSVDASLQIRGKGFTSTTQLFIEQTQLPTKYFSPNLLVATVSFKAQYYGIYYRLYAKDKGKVSNSMNITIQRKLAIGLQRTTFLSVGISESLEVFAAYLAKGSIVRIFGSSFPLAPRSLQGKDFTNAIAKQKSGLYTYFIVFPSGERTQSGAVHVLNLK